MKKLQFFGMNYLLLRSERCKMQDKFNRAAKIAVQAKQLVQKLDGFMNVSGLTERAQCALAVKLMMFTGIRVGNEESANGYVTKVHPQLQKKGVKPEFRQTFGLTTLTKQHVRVHSGKVIFSFVGKKGVAQRLVITDKKLVAQCRKQLTLNNDGNLFLNVSDYEVRKFVKKSVGSGYMVKDFRTMFANTIATEQVLGLMRKGKLSRKKDLKAEQKAICENVAARLGNTPAISKRAYIDPEILSLHEMVRMQEKN